MSLALTVDVLNAINSEKMAHAWLLDLYTDEGTLRCWDKPFNMSYGGFTYEGLSDTFGLEGEIRLSTELVPEPLTISFDASPQSDNAAFVGRLVDRQWHQRPMRIRGLLLVPGTDFATPIGTHIEWNGTMDTQEIVESGSGYPLLVLGCEGGIFRALDRNYTACTDPDQKLRDPTDRLFENVAFKPQQDVPFGRSWSNIPGAGGRAVSGGATPGGGGPNAIRFRSR